jgi:stringent starvation protein B
VPVDHVIAIYARENGQGMAFPAPVPATTAGPEAGRVARDARARPASGARAVGFRFPGRRPRAAVPRACRPRTPKAHPPSPAAAHRGPTLKRVK